MQTPNLSDTIVAISSAWQAAPIGIIRLSGTDSFDILRAVGIAPPDDLPSQPHRTSTRLVLAVDVSLPADIFWFSAPRSYTSQNVVELHTVGCLPLLRRLAARLIEAGARRALPGEFTSRAFLAGKLNAVQVDGVLGLISAESAAAARQAVRMSRGRQDPLLGDILERTTDLLALIEAGIDFVEEEDVRFITAPQARAALDELLERLVVCERELSAPVRGGVPHVALAGLPNAGKSTLFNALVGFERAVVSPVVGTTRDVVSAEVRLEGASIVLQDCAGLGSAADELEAAAHLAGETAAEQADLILWVHEAARAWTPDERVAAVRIAADRRLLVLSKCDARRTAPDSELHEPEFSTALGVSAATGAGLPELRRQIARQLGGGSGGRLLGDALLESATAARASFERARSLVAMADGDVPSPELVALELQCAYEALNRAGQTPAVEAVLGRIFARFCVGK